jgi:hypothetical protein
MATKSPSARSYAFLSIGAAIVTIALKFLAYVLTNSVGLLSPYELVCSFDQIVRDYLWLGVNTEVVLLLLSNEGSSQASAGSTCNIPGMSCNHPDITLSILNETVMTGGELAIAPNASMSISEITLQILLAKQRGLQFEGKMIKS